MSTRPPPPDAFELPSPASLRWGRLLNPWRNCLLPAILLRTLLRRSPSPLLQETFTRPGGWRSMRIIHAASPPVDLWDRQALHTNPLSIETRNRRRLVTRILSEWMGQQADLPRIDLLGVGAGPGLHLQDAVVRSGRDPSTVRIFLIDRDSDAESYGRSEAAVRGLADQILWIHGDARDLQRLLPEVHPHLAKIVGLLEYLTDPEAHAMLSCIRERMPIGGILLTHGFVDRFGMAPFFARVFGLKHVQRTADQVERLLVSSGFDILGEAETPLGIFPIRWARATRAETP